MTEPGMQSFLDQLRNQRIAAENAPGNDSSLPSDKTVLRRFFKSVSDVFKDFPKSENPFRGLFRCAPFFSGAAFHSEQKNDVKSLAPSAE